MKPPAFQFYADDFIGGTCDLSAADVGAYIRLLCYQWSRGAIPSEPDKLERVAGGKVSDDVLAKFPGGKNERMERERQKQDEYRALQSAKGRASAQARFNRGSTVVQPERQPDGQPKGNSPSPSPSPKNTHTLTRAEIPTWEEVKRTADVRGVPTDSAKRFFDHHEGNQLWINQHGKVINWQYKLTTWAASDRTVKPSGQNGKQTAPAAPPCALKPRIL